jgi:hypothetical protein
MIWARMLAYITGTRVSRRVCVAGITPHPDQQWMDQMGRNVTMQKWGFLANSRYLLHDRDGSVASFKCRQVCRRASVVRS